MTEFDEHQEVGFRIHMSVDDQIDRESRLMRCHVTLVCGCRGTIHAPVDVRDKIGLMVSKVQVECLVHKAWIDVMAWEWQELDS